MTNSTLSGNSAQLGGGISVFENQLTLARSLVSGNSGTTNGEEIFAGIGTGTVNADNYNVFGHRGLTNADAFDGFTPGATDITATSDGTTPTVLADILNTTLADNGGPTQTHALVAFSPAIDLGPSDDCTAAPVSGVDQRGAPRNVDGDGVASANECDTGAYEYPGATLTIAKVTDPAGGTGFPFTLDPGAYSFDFKWGSNGSDEGQFKLPYGMAVDADGNVYVVDSDGFRIQKFDAAGNFLLMWGWGVDDGTNAFQICTSGCQAGIPGNGDGQFDSPTGVAVDAAGNVYVADAINNRIQKFNSNGVFLTKWGANGGDGSSGSGDGEFSAPFGVAVDTAGFIFVADTFNNRIQKFVGDGFFAGEWGTNGSGDGEFNFPFGVAVDAAGNVYVADTFNRRIQKFDRDGNFLAKWGTAGSAEGQFGFMHGVAVDAAGNVYVADTFNRRIQKFTGSGSFLVMWGWGVDDGTAAFQNCTSGCQSGLLGSGDGQFDTPRGIAVDAAGNVYVIDSSNNRVQVFNPDSAFTLDDGQSESFNLPPGDYLVSELVPRGWVLGDYACSIDALAAGTPAAASSVVNPAQSVTLESGDDVTCTFTNVEAAKIIVIKDAVPDDPTPFDFNFYVLPGVLLQTFTLDDDGDPDNTYSNRQELLVAPDDYAVTESPPPAGWELTDIACESSLDPDKEFPIVFDPFTSGFGTIISAEPGEVITCTFTNEPEAVPGVCPAETESTTTTRILGIGMYPNAAATVKIPNPSQASNLYIQLAGKKVPGGVYTAARFKVFRNAGVLANITDNTLESKEYRSDAVFWYGRDISAWDGRATKVNGQLLVAANSVKNMPRALILYADYPTKDGAEYWNYATRLDQSNQNHVYWAAGWIATQTYTVDFPVTLSEAREIAVQAALVDNDPDTRRVVLTIEVQDGSGNVLATKTFNPAGPSLGGLSGNNKMLNLINTTLNAPAGAAKLVFRLESPRTTGDSAALVGLAANYICELP